MRFLMLQPIYLFLLVIVYVLQLSYLSKGCIPIVKTTCALTKTNEKNVKMACNNCVFAHEMQTAASNHAEA